DGPEPPANSGVPSSGASGWRAAFPAFIPLAAGSTFTLLDHRMSEPPTVDIRAHLDAVFRAESGRILATLIRLLGDFDRAEDAMHDAFNAALQRWPGDGLPANPRAWLISTARFKAIDAIRRRARLVA